MIRPEKLKNALYALQGVLSWARQMAFQNAPHSELAKLLDYAEEFPQLLSGSKDETEVFRANLADVSEKFDCAFVLQRFDDSVPENW